MPQAAHSTTTSRRALLSRSATLTAAGALAACVPHLAPAAEAGANPELVRLLHVATECRDAEEALYATADTAEQEDRIWPEALELSDRRADALASAAELPLRTPADFRAAARAIVALAYVHDEDGEIGLDSFLAETGLLARRIITTLAAQA